MRGSERLTALALLLLSAAAALSGADGAGARLAAFAAMLLVVWLLARTGATVGPLGWLRDFTPIAVVVVTFLLLQPLIVALHPHRCDEALAAADRAWLGGLPGAWFGLLGRPSWLVDLAYAGYWSFYLLPISVAVAARARRGGPALEQVASAVLLCFYLSFLGYFLWPALGPRTAPALEDVVLGGGDLARTIRGFLRAAEATTLDAFPSGHAAISLVTAVAGARLFPRLAGALLAWAALVIFATVYISVHYVVDVLGGVALGLLVVGLAGPAARWLGDRPRGG